MRDLQDLKIHPPPPFHYKVKHHQKLGEEGNLLFLPVQVPSRSSDVLSMCHFFILIAQQGTSISSEASISSSSFESSNTVLLEF
jgi:hypothetical protein